jgi:3-oxoacyl-[acyl-carrier protein] reductase
LKVAIVTGGSSGIGAAAVEELGRRGWQVAVMARKGAQAEFQGDVARDADCRRVAKAVLDKWGRIDALVNNAGTTKFVKHGDLEGLGAADYERIFGINLVGPFQMVRACAGALKASRGAVVNVSSVAALRGTGSSIAYAASKAALNTMTQSLARALAPDVRVNAVLPGFVRTPWQEAQGREVADETERNFAATAVLRRAVDAADVADAIAWLIEGARSTTGETILVDSGIHLATGR